jgi:micrococcal nuclease
VRLTPLLILLVVLTSCGAADGRGAARGDAAQRPPRFEAEARALDGDTVSVDFRLLGVDAFERKQLCQRDGACWACGKAAQDLAASQVRDETASFSLTPDATYGRPVATVTVDGKDLGETMIRAGLAIPAMKYLRRDPDRASAYAAAYEAAERNHVGAHAGTWLDPAKWRRGERLECERR